MYNFSIPSTLKAWIDQVVRVGRTVNYGSSGPEGLAKGKKAFVLAARGGGGYGSGEQMQSYDFQEPYLKLALGFMGITDVTFINDEKTLSNESNLDASIEQVKTAAHSVA